MWVWRTLCGAGGPSCGAGEPPCIAAQPLCGADPSLSPGIQPLAADDILHGVDVLAVMQCVIELRYYYILPSYKIFPCVIELRYYTLVVYNTQSRLGLAVL